jgi:choline-sulfatase
MSTSESRDQISRRRLLGGAAAAVGAAALSSAVPVPALARGNRAASGPAQGKNIVLFITDQERQLQHFPMGWAERNLPGLTAMKETGVEFTHAFTNACMCSPARSTLLTGLMPSQHGVKYTLEEDMPADQYPQVELPGPTQVANLATVMSSAGYNVIYKGKWHCSKPAGSEWAPSDLTKYGFNRWNPTDAGADQSIQQAGGGVAANDDRYMASVGNYADGVEGVLPFIQNVAVNMQPFCLIVSLVNPHDVLMYPRNYKNAGYDDGWLDGDIGLPATVDEDLSTKPSAQRAFLKIFNLSGALPTPRMKRRYLNFYANLMKNQDAYLVEVMAALKSIATPDGSNLLNESILIRTADHGEMGLAHGGMRQKNFNMYDETIRIPLVFSNPELFPKRRVVDDIVGHVDLVPTLASLVGAPAPTTNGFTGVDYSSVLLNPKAKPVQNYTMFTWDDYQNGQKSGPYVPPPQHIVGIRERRWKIAKYWDPNGTVPPQWEFYDLVEDPLESINMAYRGYRRTPEQEREYKRMRAKLQRVEETRLQPLGASS